MLPLADSRLFLGFGVGRGNLPTTFLYSEIWPLRQQLKPSKKIKEKKVSPEGFAVRGEHLAVAWGTAVPVGH